ncbi:hypothetical protein GQ55_3G214600 [Panicum hallii var. hallii]|uniref:Uncharacterized protein n=1 Tax=Panicum hallii var. hallii TaxID=1504633 RepID=A0A2T7EBX0_9POAL|nr:hypothetical protein GQ55_3G214600 [Panicum hallii var. hallii]
MSRRSSLVNDYNRSECYTNQCGIEVVPLFCKMSSRTWEPSKVTSFTSTMRDRLNSAATAAVSICRSSASAMPPPPRTARSASAARRDGKSAPVIAEGSSEKTRSKAPPENGRRLGSARRTSGGKSTRSIPVTSPTPAAWSASTAWPAPAERQRTREGPARKPRPRSGGKADAARAAVRRRQRGETRSLARRRSGGTTRREAASQELRGNGASERVSARERGAGKQEADAWRKRYRSESVARAASATETGATSPCARRSIAGDELTVEASDWIALINRH